MSTHPLHSSANGTPLVRRLTARIRQRTHLIPASELHCPTTVVAPHPDDESLGCGGTILRLTGAGVPVRLIVLTDGEASHPKLIAPDELAARRRNELLAAARELGIPAKDVHCLGLRDGSLHRDLAPAIERIVDLFKAAPSAQVLVPYRHDRLRDHEATNRIVHGALAQLDQRPRILEYPVWLWDHWPWTRPWRPALRARLKSLADAPGAWRQLTNDFRWRVDVDDLLTRKATALACHTSQMVRPEGRPEWTVLADVAQGRWLARFFCGFELFHAPASSDR